MATFCLSRLADADLMDIGRYTLRTWGEGQTIRYILNALDLGDVLLVTRLDPLARHRDS